eukprot:741588-Pleurochrysis_carterae.AAC.1
MCAEHALPPIRVNAYLCVDTRERLPLTRREKEGCAALSEHRALSKCRVHRNYAGCECFPRYGYS